VITVAKDLLIREMNKAKMVIKSETKVKEAFEMSIDKRIIILPEELPWRRVLSEKLEVMFVVYPRNDGRWGVRAIPDIGYTSRRSLPAEWAGKTDQDLQEITGVTDAVFCHRGLFMALAESKEGAIKLAKLALDA